MQLIFGIEIVVVYLQVQYNALFTSIYRKKLTVFSAFWGTGIRGLMRGMATLPKVTRSY